MTNFRQALVGLGGNLGDRAATLRDAVARLGREPGIGQLVISRCYETDPVGVTDQPAFLNQVAVLETTLAPEELLRVLQTVEHEFGRVRTVRWGPRTLDLDLLAFEDESRDSPELTLPHPRLAERAFVVVPLLEVLDRSPFDRAVWESLRRRILSAPPDASGVRPFRPGTPGADRVLSP